MSLKPEPIGPIPQETARLAKAVFPEGSPFIKMRDELGTLYQDEMFAPLFPKDGQPALAPWRLALVTIMQFAEGLSDRQAAHAVRARLDWKYALGLELEDRGFDFSVLSEFRSRLIEGHMEYLLFETMLNCFKQRDYSRKWSKRARQGEDRWRENGEQGEDDGETRSSPSARSKSNGTPIPLEDRSQSGKDGKFLLTERLGKREQLGKSSSS